MLEKPEERVRLLRAGYTGKRIEQLYIEHNSFRIVHIPATIGIIELDIPPDKGYVQAMRSQSNVFDPK